MALEFGLKEERDEISHRGYYVGGDEVQVDDVTEPADGREAGVDGDGHQTGGQGE